MNYGKELCIPVNVFKHLLVWYAVHNLLAENMMTQSGRKVCFHIRCKYDLAVECGRGIRWNILTSRVGINYLARYCNMRNMSKYLAYGFRCLFNYL